MKHRIVSISLAVALVLGVGLIGCGGEGAPEIAQYSLTISSTEGGSVITPREGTSIYDEGTTVNLVATPGSCYYFVSWTGDVGAIADVNAASTSITMNSDYSITANFQEKETVTFLDTNLEAVVTRTIGEPTGPICPSVLAALTVLDATGENISDLTGLEYATSLTELRLGSNQISDISPLANLTSLTELWLEGNQVSDISPLADLTNLTYLYLEHNQISDGDLLHLAALTKLTYLTLGFTQISDISPLANLTSLTGLSLGDNQISDISSLASLTSLLSLSLVGNQIGDITALSGLIELRTLYLGSNQVSDLADLSGLVNLGGWPRVFSRGEGEGILIDLGLSYNQITDISALLLNEGLSEGDVIDLSGNPLNADSLDAYIPQLEGRGVTVLWD